MSPLGTMNLCSSDLAAAGPLPLSARGACLSAPPDIRQCSSDEFALNSPIETPSPTTGPSYSSVPFSQGPACRSSSPSPYTGFYGALDRFFKISERGSSVAGELRGGIVLYATMCYIIAVNPDILSSAGMNRSSVATSTAICGALSTLMMSFYANLPFGAVEVKHLKKLSQQKLKHRATLYTR
eukprot:GHVT01088002.1.p2 GENE.GHVT01088002.1~~GHVT01088002.1.p2  ORF type:complete len:183 (-),score=16.33 GHVT01088002.1:1820-2368(-)